MRTVLGRIDTISEFIGMTVRWLAIVMILVLFQEVVMRYAFNSPSVWAYELCVSIWGFYIILGACYVLRHDEHVRLDLIYARLSLRTQAIIDVFTYLLFFTYCIVILLYAVPWGWESMIRLERFQTQWRSPIWPMKLMVPIAIFLLLLQGTARYIRSFYTAITGSKL